MQKSLVEKIIDGLPTNIRHALTAVPAAGAAALAHGWVTAGEAAQIDELQVQVVTVGSAVLGGVLGRLILLGLSKLGPKWQKLLGMSAVVTACTMFAGCTPAGVERWEQFKAAVGPVRVGVTVDDATVTYDSKGGLGVAVDARSGK